MKKITKFTSDFGRNKCLETDASTGIGVGGWTSDGDSFQHRWDQSCIDKVINADIYWKETAGVCIAILLFGKKWFNENVLIHCDNQGAVFSIAKKSCKFHRDDVQQLIRTIFNNANKNKAWFRIEHIPGELNFTADALSRFYENKWRQDCQVAMNPQPTNCISCIELIARLCFN